MIAEGSDCEFEIQYLGIQLFCHTHLQPAFFIGKGETKSMMQFYSLDKQTIRLWLKYC